MKKFYQLLGGSQRCVASVFSRAWQVDSKAFALRWSAHRYLSLHVITDVVVDERRKRESQPGNRGSNFRESSVVNRDSRRGTLTKQTADIITVARISYRDFKGERSVQALVLHLHARRAHTHAHLRMRHTRTRHARTRAHAHTRRAGVVEFAFAEFAWTLSRARTTLTQARHGSSR